ncbi:uncharacterized protein LOC141907424 [Tubulanus polymorphus]|uniref:uncharacterized protein LOC141907424 n=1 Tax=Tubulanus polymorphus TaxID=672921 RepID=UPI003DA2B398
MPEHDIVRISVIFWTCLTFIVTVTINALAAQGISPFLNTTGGISNIFPTDITPAGWTFSIWGIIYTWQVLWLIYGVTTICRSSDGGHLYYKPDFMPITIYVWYIANLLFNMAWIILWDRALPEFSLPMSALMAGTLYAAIFISHRNLAANEDALQKQGLGREIWFVRFLVQNGLALYASWVTIATLINFAVVLSYTTGAVVQHTASTISLSILISAQVAWVVTNAFLRKYLVFTFSPYVVVIFALSGVISANWRSGDTNSVLTVVCFVISVVGLALQIFYIVKVVKPGRKIENPVFENPVKFTKE